LSKHFLGGLGAGFEEPVMSLKIKALIYLGANNFAESKRRRQENLAAAIVAGLRWEQATKRS